jgi:ribosomal protein L21E
MLSSGLRDHIHAAVRARLSLAAGDPFPVIVVRRAVSVHANGDSVRIEVEGVAGSGVAGYTHSGAGGVSVAAGEALTVRISSASSVPAPELMSELQGLKCAVSEARDAEDERSRKLVKMLAQVVHNQASYINMYPGFRPQTVSDSQRARTTAPGERPAELSRAPSSLAVLWQEWKEGLNGNKPACLFTSRESGRKDLKSTFCRRKRLWWLWRDVIKAGHDVARALEATKQAYGEDLEVMQYLEAIRKDDGAAVRVRLGML